MRYEMMFPHQIRRAIEENWPVVLPLGVLEYHGEHCVSGVDTLLITRALEILETEINVVILPAFYYGAASFAVEAPEGKGTLPITADSLIPLAKSIYTQLLRVGFRNIHSFVHHQSENFETGMPTDLAFRFAARQVLFEFQDKTCGEGWWGRPEMKDYYENQAAGIDPFGWIKIHPFMGADLQKRWPVDHAGIQETSLMMAFCPEGVQMNKHDKKLWYTESAQEANLAYGNAAKAAILCSLKNILTKGPARV